MSFGVIGLLIFINRIWMLMLGQNRIELIEDGNTMHSNKLLGFSFLKACHNGSTLQQADPTSSYKLLFLSITFQLAGSWERSKTNFSTYWIVFFMLLVAKLHTFSTRIDVCVSFFSYISTCFSYALQENSMHKMEI